MAQLAQAQRPELAQKRPPVRSQAAVGRDHLVEVAGKAFVAERLRAWSWGGRTLKLGHGLRRSVRVPLGRSRPAEAGPGDEILFHEYTTRARYRGGLRRSRVKGASRLGGSEATLMEPGVWPNGRNRAARRLSASLALTGNVSNARPPGCAT